MMSTNLRYSAVAIKIGVDLRKHMKRRYDNTFSYEFLEIIQSHFACCDVPWYRLNYRSIYPISCYNNIGINMIINDVPCMNIIATIVTTRSAWFVFNLVLALISLTPLIYMDWFDLLKLNNLFLRKHSTRRAQQREAKRSPDRTFIRPSGPSGSVSVNDINPPSCSHVNLPLLGPIGSSLRPALRSEMIDLTSSSTRSS